MNKHAVKYLKRHNWTFRDKQMCLIWQIQNVFLQELSHTRIGFYSEGPFKETFAGIYTLINKYTIPAKQSESSQQDLCRSARIAYRHNLKRLQTFWNTRIFIGEVIQSTRFS